jgi:hypothetical protein
MKTTIGKFDPESRQVPVTFTEGKVIHKRQVNAILKEDGSYDAAATKLRVGEVAQGVAHKIGLGVITVPQPEPDLPSTTEPTVE